MVTCCVQIIVLEAGALKFGPVQGPLHPLFSNWESEMSGLIKQLSTAYSDADWNLAIEATAQLCPPPELVGVQVKFIVQVRPHPWTSSPCMPIAVVTYIVRVSVVHACHECTGGVGRQPYACSDL